MSAGRLEPLVTVTDAPDPPLGIQFIDLFFLPDGLRGAGLGRRILELAEDEGRSRGCPTSRVFMTKTLDPAGT